MNPAILPAGFRVPKAVVVSGDGDLLVGCAISRGGIQCFRRSGPEAVFSPEWSMPVGSVRGMVSVAGGKLYATMRDGEIMDVGPDGSELGRWGTPLDLEGRRFAAPSGIATDRDGAIYVVESSGWNSGVEGGHRVQKFSREREFLTAWGRKGRGEGELNVPTGIAVDQRGLVFVADSYNSRVQVFEPDGAFVAKWGLFGSGEGQLNCPQGIAFDPGGNVVLADTYNNRIQVFTSDGRFVRTWNNAGRDDDAFWLPCGVAVDDQGTIYVADSMNDRIVAMEG